MKINECSGKYFRIICKDGEIFEGRAYDYIPPQDNIPEIASISIDSVEILEEDIESIKEIQ